MRYALTVVCIALVTMVFGGKSPDTTVVRIEGIQSPEKRTEAYNLAAESAWMNGNFLACLDYASRGLTLSKQQGYDALEAKLLTNRGIGYEYLSQYPSALEDYFAALEIQEKLDDPEMEAYILSSIGLVYLYQTRYEQSMEYHERALKIRRRINDRHGISASLNNLAILYTKNQNFERAIDYYEECIRIDKSANDSIGLGDDYNNIALTYLDWQQYEKALEYLQLAIKIRLASGDQTKIAETYNNFGTLYYNTGEYTRAKPYLLKATKLADQIRNKELLRFGYDLLAKTAAHLGDSANAFVYYQRFIAYRDSIDNSEIARKQTELEMTYAFNKEKELAEMQQAEKDRQQAIILYSVSGGLLLILGFSILLFRKWRETRRQQLIIEENNKIVEQKNEEILDSISYARRIQRAILPPEEEFSHHLPQHFILYQPRDIVSGDFYWLAEQGDRLIVAVADCTGHGVPGALMSVVCSNALNRAVREFGLENPATILDKTRDLIQEELSKGGQSVQDGMDISLCSIDRSRRILHWAGANLPLWILRVDKKEIEEWKGDKQPIGLYSHSKPFSGQQIQLTSGDRLYLFSDGFADQFGGPGGKKLTTRRFKEWVAESAKLSIEEQGNFLSDSFKTWKGKLDQIDDVCLIGVEIV